uniref:Tumor necrosis factor ligand superfamily member 8 n=1 Tax=Equus caballus TaxID=9796 RepID=A0A9L0RD02_HORSE
MWGRLYKNGPRAAASTQPSGPFSRRSHACARRLRRQPLGNHQAQLLFHHGHAGSVSRLRRGNHYGVGSSEDGNCSEDILCILEKAPFKKSWAYLQASKHINKTKLSWNKDGIVHGVRYQDGNLVIQFPGWYFIICQLQFLVKCPEHPVDLKLELLINKDVKKQTLVTVCESGAQSKNIYQNLSQFLLEHLQVNTTISVKVDKFQYVDTNTFPLENVLSIFLYSSSD